MSEFDEKLNSILSNPDTMAQIMQMAQALSGGEGASPPPPPPPQPPVPPTQATTGSPDLFSSLAGGIDPSLIVKFLPLIRELGGQQDSNSRQLLYALRPYLKPERQEKVERAIQLARLYHLGKKFLAGWEG